MSCPGMRDASDRPGFGGDAYKTQNKPAPYPFSMGLNLKDVAVREKTALEAFGSKVVAIDAYNAIYQFLSNIRGSDGMPLADLKGNVTSHLSGLLFRNTNFLALGIKPIWVFDGKPPSLKTAEIERRKTAKVDAAVKYEKAITDGNMEEARKYAQQTTSIKDAMVSESKELLGLFGIPCIQAPSEGEATAAHLTVTGQAWASASQDYDSILFGARRLVRNFTNSGRRKVPNRNFYVAVEPEMILLENVLKSAELSRPQLVDIGILIGTDFNPSGFTRIGPKTALKLIKKHSRLEDIPQIQEGLSGVPYEEIRRIFLEPDVADVDEIEFGKPDHDGVIQYLVERDFLEARVAQSLNRMKRVREKQNQTLERWF